MTGGKLTVAQPDGTRIGFDYYPDGQLAAKAPLPAGVELTKAGGKSNSGSGFFAKLAGEKPDEETPESSAMQTAPLPGFSREPTGQPGEVIGSNLGSSTGNTPGMVPIRLTPKGSQSDGVAIASSLCDPFGVDFAFEGSGGIAALNPRLLSANPSGSRKEVAKCAGSPTEVVPSAQSVNTKTRRIRNETTSKSPCRSPRSAVTSEWKNLKFY
jgi:hypothetical protein